MAKKPERAPIPLPEFALLTYLDAPAAARRTAHHTRGAVIFSQGDECADVCYLVTGTVKLSVVSSSGREAILALLPAGSFFGEGCLTSLPRYLDTATAAAACSVLRVEKALMLDLLHTHTSLADQFRAHVLTRNIRIEADLVDHLFNNTEKRLARVLLLLARYGTEKQQLLLPRLPQGTLAEMVGSTRPQVNKLMNKFRDLGFVDYGKGAIAVNDSLLTVVLHDDQP